MCKVLDIPDHLNTDDQQHGQQEDHNQSLNTEGETIDGLLDRIADAFLVGKDRVQIFIHPSTLQRRAMRIFDVKETVLPFPFCELILTCVSMICLLVVF